MSAATCSVNKKLPDGTLISIGGTSADDLVRNLETLFGVEATANVVGEVKHAFGVNPLATPSPLTRTEQAAVAAVRQAFPGSVTVAQNAPLPQPPLPGPAAPPPTVNYPGDCEHGRRTYVDKPAKGKAWRRWECAKPWEPNNREGNLARCKPINV